MQDTVIKNTGNSRSIKVPPGTSVKYDSVTAMLQDMEAGNFPIDLGPLNAAGCDVIGTLLNKANLLPDSVEQAIWGSAANRTVAQALQQLRSLISTAQSTANGKLWAQTGTYVGTAAMNSGDTSKTLSFFFAPLLVIVTVGFPGDTSMIQRGPMVSPLVALRGCAHAILYAGGGASLTERGIPLTWGASSLTWTGMTATTYGLTTYHMSYNAAGGNYSWIAIG